MKYAPPAGIEPEHTRKQCYPILYRRGYKTPASVLKKMATMNQKSSNACRRLYVFLITY